MARIGMIGAGSWGTALAAHLAGCGHKVEIWSIMKDEVDMLSLPRLCAAPLRIWQNIAGTAS